MSENTQQLSKKPVIVLACFLLIYLQRVAIKKTKGVYQTIISQTL